MHIVDGKLIMNIVDDRWWLVL